MATRYSRPDEINHLLKIVSLSLMDLRDVAPEWDEMNIGVKSAWDYEWRDYMHMFEELLLAYRARHMNDDQKTRFLTLQRELDESSDLIESLGLQRPPVLSGT